MTNKKEMMPEIVNPIETPTEKAKRIFHLSNNVDELTTDDLLQHIFNLANEVQGEDPKNAVNFRVAIDTMQYLYEEIQKKPPRRANEKDESLHFLKEWGIIDE